MLLVAMLAVVIVVHGLAHGSVACAGDMGGVRRASGSRPGCRNEPGQQDGEPAVMAAGG